MIPKVIHYCWFGGNPLPDLALKCIESWKKYLPDYEIKEWNESNFDVNLIPYTAEAYKSRKYAFVSDYARFWVLFHYGGLYFDTDVEVIKKMDDLIARGPFMGCEHTVSDVNNATGFDLGVAPGLGLGALPGMPFYEQIISIYSNQHFIDSNGAVNLKTIVSYTTELLVEKGLEPVNEIQLIDGIRIYPKEYFCPMDYLSRQLYITPQSVSIHHYDGSWLTEEEKYALDVIVRLKWIPQSISIHLGCLIAAIRFHGWGYAFKLLTGKIRNGIVRFFH